MVYDDVMSNHAPIPAGTLVTVHTINGGRVTGTLTDSIRRPEPSYTWPPVAVTTHRSWGDLAAETTVRVTLPIFAVVVGGQVTL